jgi:hypothetical protein
MSKTGADYAREQQPGPGKAFTSSGDVFDWTDNLLHEPRNLWRGKYPGAYNVATHGEKVVTGAAANLPLWPLDTFPDPLDVGAQMSVVSSSAQDSPTGTGARLMLMTYLDDHLDQYTEVVALNGTTPVLTQATNIRWVQDLLILAADTTAGSPRATVGTITVAHGGVTYGVISAGYLDQTTSFLMIPRGYYGYVDEVFLSSTSTNADASAIIRTVVYGNGLLLPRNAVGLQNNAWAISVTTGSRLPPGTLLGMSVTCAKSLTATGSFIGRLEPVT